MGKTLEKIKYLIEIVINMDEKDFDASDRTIVERIGVAEWEGEILPILLVCTNMQLIIF